MKRKKREERNDEEEGILDTPVMKRLKTQERGEGLLIHTKEANQTGGANYPGYPINLS